jgi:hypothetical protein
MPRRECSFHQEIAMPTTTLAKKHSRSHTGIDIVCAIAAISALLGSSKHAHAEEAASTVVYPGAGCQATNGLDAAKLFHQPTGIFNFSAHADSFDITCPIVRFRSESLNGLRVLVHVRRTAPGLAGFVNCSVLSFRRGGVEIAGTASRRTVQGGTDDVEILRMTVNKSVPHGHYAMQCFIGSDFGIAKYEVTEL